MYAQIYMHSENEIQLIYIYIYMIIYNYSQVQLNIKISNAAWNTIIPNFLTSLGFIYMYTYILHTYIYDIVLKCT